MSSWFTFRQLREGIAALQEIACTRPLTTAEAAELDRLDRIRAAKLHRLAPPRFATARPATRRTA